MTTLGLACRRVALKSCVCATLLAAVQPGWVLQRLLTTLDVFNARHNGRMLCLARGWQTLRGSKTGRIQLSWQMTDSTQGSGEDMIWVAQCSASFNLVVLVWSPYMTGVIALYPACSFHIQLWHHNIVDASTSCQASFSSFLLSLISLGFSLAAQ